VIILETVFYRNFTQTKNQLLKMTPHLRVKGGKFFAQFFVNFERKKESGVIILFNVAVVTVVM